MIEYPMICDSLGTREMTAEEYNKWKAEGTAHKAMDASNSPSLPTTKERLAALESAMLAMMGGTDNV